MNQSVYKFETSKHFERKYKALVKKNSILKRRIKKVFKIMRKDPFYKGLNTHRVDALNLGIHYSSNVTGDIRIIWDFDKRDGIVILLLTIGGHSGGNRVYF